MALSDPQDTLSYHQSRVLTSFRNMGHVPTPSVAKAAREYLLSHGNPNVSPEGSALTFYGLNHGMSLIRARRDVLEPLPPAELAFVRDYYATISAATTAAFTYLLVICTRESRHNKSLGTALPKIKETFGKPMHDFVKKYVQNEGTILEGLKNDPPNVPIGDYVDCLRWQFYNCNWNSGYGGKAWGAVTDCLARFVHGEFSAEMMMDTIWTLCHNNGPIFNKQTIYQMYSGNLVRILDIQRSGQIPEAVLYDPNAASYVTPALRKNMQFLKDEFPGEIGDYVDWYTVEALGAVHAYPKEKSAQTQQHGVSPKASEAEKKKALADKAAAQAAAAKKAKFDAEHYEIMPGQYLKKIQRAA